MNKRLEDWVNWILYDELKNGVIKSASYLRQAKTVRRWNVWQRASMDFTVQRRNIREQNTASRQPIRMVQRL